MGLDRDNGKENASYCLGFRAALKPEIVDDIGGYHEDMRGLGRTSLTLKFVVCKNQRLGLGVPYLEYMTIFQLWKPNGCLRYMPHTSDYLEGLSLCWWARDRR